MSRKNVESDKGTIKTDTTGKFCGGKHAPKGDRSAPGMKRSGQVTYGADNPVAGAGGPAGKGNPGNTGYSS